MFKTIFGKLFAVYLGALIIGFVFLGLVATTFMRGFFIDQKTDDLRKQCESVSNRVKVNYMTSLYTYFDESGGRRIETRGHIALDTLERDLRALYQYIGVSLFVIEISDAETLTLGKLYYAEESPDKIMAALSSAMVKPVLEGGEKAFQGNLMNVYEENVLALGYPVVINDRPVAAIFISAPLAEIESKAADFVRVIVACLLVAAFASFVFVYLSSRQISRPIHEISEASKVIAGGDFEKRLNIKSRDEIGQLARSFNEMAESLNEQETRRREFVANISHDLRSPLTSIKGFLQAMIDGTIPEPKRDHYLGVIMSEAERMTRLANNVLDLNRVNAQTELNITQFDVNELISQTALSLESRIDGKKLEMNINFAEDKLPVSADREKIQRVIYNLLDNAIKFTPESGIIAIETSEEEGGAKISIKDSGAGIPPDEQKRVFDRFYKSDASRGKDKSGSGLGLSIVKEFIKAHNETIELKSNEGEGCEFTFRLKKF